MLFSRRVVACLILCAGAADRLAARQWTDVTGKYSIEADLIAFNEDSVIIQRADKELGTVPIEKLSVADREYLKSKEALQTHSDRIDTLQTWMTSDGLAVVGKIVDYTRRDVEIQRRRGKIYVNNTQYKNLPPIYQSILLQIVSSVEGIDVPDLKALDKWVRSLRGQPRLYTLEGVTMELENGDEYSVPFFLLAEQDQAILKPGWDAWLQDQADYEKREDHAFRLQARTSEYQRDRAVDRRIAELNLNMQAIQAGLTSAWEVTLYPQPGNPNPPQWVVTMGRNSREATIAALRQNPGYTDGPVRKISW